MELEVVVSLISLCKTAANSGSIVLEKYRKKKLSDEEKKLLVSASADGEFYILAMGDGIPWLRVGGVDFVDDNVPA